MLELYQSEECPYSESVRHTMSELGLSYVAHNPRLPGEDPDVTNEHTYQELLELSEEDEIPLLVDTDRRDVVSGSDRIVSFLEEHYR